MLGVYLVQFEFIAEIKGNNKGIYIVIIPSIYPSLTGIYCVEAFDPSPVFLAVQRYQFRRPITQTVTYRVAADDDAWQLSSSPFGCRLSVAVAGAGLLQLELLPGQHSNLSLISSWLNQAHSVNASVGYPAWGEGFPGKVQSRQMQWQTGKASLRSGELGVFIKGLEQGWRWTFELGQSDGFLLEVDTSVPEASYNPCASAANNCSHKIMTMFMIYLFFLPLRNRWNGFVHAGRYSSRGPLCGSGSQHQKKS